MSVRILTYGQLEICSQQGSRIYLYSYFRDPESRYKVPVYAFNVWETARMNEDKFSFILAEMPNNIDLKCVDLYATNKEYMGRGISYAMIKEAKILFKKRVISSSKKFPILNGESRWPEATRVWENLIKTHDAKYDSEYDYYFTV